MCTNIPILKTGLSKRGIIIPFFLSLFLFTNSDFVNAQIINSFAGVPGPAGYSGDGGPALSAKLSYPLAITTDKSGNVFIADYNNYVIRKVNSAGIISTFAGNHTAGYSGDGGLATAAQLSKPSSIACDDQGNLYIVDSDNSVVRRVDAAGIITTIAGNGIEGYNGDGGPATAAQLDLTFSMGMTVDGAGNIYIIQRDQHVVRKINNLGIISTIAGTGAAGNTGDGGPAIAASLNQPEAVLADGTGNLYISTSGARVIRKINTLGNISTFAGTGASGFSGDGGPASAAQFSVNSPMGLAKDLCGNIYVADYQNSRIRKVNTSGIIETVVGNGANGIAGNGGNPLFAELWFPGGLAVDPQGDIYILDVFNNNIRKVSYPAGSITVQPNDISVCKTGNAKFTIAANNPTTYRWQINAGPGWSNLTDDLTYSGTTTNELNVTGVNVLMNNYQFRCVVTTASCNQLFSSSALLQINSLNTSVKITMPTSVCPGTSATFTAMPQSGGTSPSYQWTKNGVAVGTDSSCFTDVNPKNGDTIQCLFKSIDSCDGSTIAVSSNKIILKINPAVISSISIVASDTIICSGTAATFTSKSVNAGANPTYTWFKNGVNLFHDSPVYIDTTLNDRDEIMCVMRPDTACASSHLVLSNTIIVNISSKVSPTITISTARTTVCPGSTVTFSATTTHGSSSPIFQWFKNGNQVGPNGAQYVDSSIVQGDKIICILTNTNNCFAVSSAVSNSIVMSVFTAPVVSLSKSSTLCNGGTRQLDAGIFTSYLWNDGTTGRNLSVDKLGTYYVSVTDNNGCRGTDTTKLTTLLQGPSHFLPRDTSFCSLTQIAIVPKLNFRSYLWNTNSTKEALNISTQGMYWLEVTDDLGCKGRDSIVVSEINCRQGFYMPDAFTPNMDGKNDLFKPVISGQIKMYSLSIFNRWGQLIFQTSDPAKGWNGNHSSVPQDNSVFVWVCSYQFEGEAVQNKKGTVVLVR